MSWGFFVDLELSLPTAEWKRLQGTPGHVLPAGWWGLESADLESRFSGPVFDSAAFKKVWSFWTDGDRAMKTVVDAKGTTTARLTIHLDRGSDMGLAKPVAALFDAAAKVGGRGSIRLLNDGSYVGESGIEITIEDGTLVRSAVDEELVETFQHRVWPELAAIVDRYTSPAAAKRLAKKPAAKKPAAKKPAAKKPAAKKPAAKKPTKKR